jgi:hypothetical protein
MTSNVDLNLVGARLDELLRVAREHTDQLAALDKGQRRLDMRLEELADEVKVQGAILAKLENSLERAVSRIGDRLKQLEER